MTCFPVDNRLFNLTGRYGPRKSFRLPNGVWTSDFHGGDDLAPETPGKRELIYAIEGAQVHSVGRKADAGVFIILTLRSGYRIRYCHLTSYGVRAGEQVKERQIIGRVGDSGNAKGVHLHFEVYPPDTLNKRLDPRPFYWKGENPAIPKAQAPAPARPTPAPAPKPAPSKPAPKPSKKTPTIGAIVKLPRAERAYKFNTLEHYIGNLKAGNYRIRGIINGHLKLSNGKTSGWVHRDNAKYLA